MTRQSDLRASKLLRNAKNARDPNTGDRKTWRQISQTYFQSESQAGNLARIAKGNKRASKTILRALGIKDSSSKGIRIRLKIDDALSLLNTEFMINRPDLRDRLKEQIGKELTNG